MDSSSAGRWMALDIGRKTIGVAVTDPLRVTVRPLTTIVRRTLTEDVRCVEGLVCDHGVEKLILGLPRHLDGRPSRTMECIGPLADQLRQALSTPIEWYDERLSTREAETWMSQIGLPVAERRSRRNEYAAAIILRWYLEEHD